MTYNVGNEASNIYSKKDVDWNTLEGKSILVTGASGMLASHLIDVLVYFNDHFFKNKMKLYLLIRSETSFNSRFSYLKNRSDIEVIYKDVCEFTSFKEKLDYIIHAASNASPKYYGTDPVGTLKANVVGTLNLLEIAKENDLSGFLFFSSSEVYGIVSDDSIPINENSFGVLNPAVLRSCYAESKRLGENICISYASQYKVPVKIVRPFHTYGPGMKLDDGRIFADLVRSVVKSEDIVLKSKGDAKRCFCYISDATEAFLRVLIMGENSKAYNVGNPRDELSILELANLMVNLSNNQIKVVVQVQDSNEYLKSQVNRNIPDIKELKSLGWEPSVSAKEGFDRTIRSFL